MLTIATHQHVNAALPSSTFVLLSSLLSKFASKQRGGGKDTYCLIATPTPKDFSHMHFSEEMVKASCRSTGRETDLFKPVTGPEEVALAEKQKINLEWHLTSFPDKKMHDGLYLFQTG